MRCQIIAELASNHGGDLSIAYDLITACADAGVDYCKVQAYTPERLKPDDPQRDWLTQAHLDDDKLIALQKHCDAVGVGLLVSAFDADRATFVRGTLAHDTIKVGSGEFRRHHFLRFLGHLFPRVLMGCGLSTDIDGPFSDTGARVVPFYGVSQYPARDLRAKSALLRADKSRPWGWSDHTLTGDWCEVAIEQGAWFIERHVGFTNRGRFQPWDVTPDWFTRRRRIAEACAWEGTDEHDEAIRKYVGRWGVDD